MVSYIKFLRLVAEQLSEYMPDGYKELSVEVTRANKKLGKSYDGIQICQEGSSVGVSYDLHHYYSAMDSMKQFPAVLRMLATEIVNALEERPPSLEDILEHPEYLKRHLIIDVINAVDKADELEDMPHEIWGDIAVVFRMLYVDPAGEMYSTVLTDSLFEQLNIEQNELFKIAAENTSQVFPMEVTSLDNKCVIPGDLDLMYVVSGHGAECLFYPDFIENMKLYIEGSYFICPYSTRQLIVIRDIGDLSMEFINDIAFGTYVNRQDPGLRLTKHVYYYDDVTDRIGPVEEFAYKLP